jgi:hypothetical protein
MGNDIYDITTTHMKLGVAMPIPNSSFKYWDDPGTWVTPTDWTENTTFAGRHWTAYDADTAAATVVATGAPPGHSYNFTSLAKRFYNDNRGTPTTQDVYYHFPMYLFSMADPTGDVTIFLEVDSTAAMSSPTQTTLKIITVGAIDTDYQIYTGSVAASIASADKFCRLVVGFVGTGATSIYMDNLGVMFDPFSGDGYYELTDVFSVDAPQHPYQRFTVRDTTRLGNDVRIDPSGGAEKLQVTVTWQDESLAVYEKLKQFYDINHGTPDLPGLPLLLEPNLPGYPATFMCNMSDPAYPLNKQRNINNRYGGTVTFRGIWA